MPSIVSPSQSPVLLITYRWHRLGNVAQGNPAGSRAVCNECAHPYRPPGSLVPDRQGHWPVSQDASADIMPRYLGSEEAAYVKMRFGARQAFELAMRPNAGCNGVRRLRSSLGQRTAIASWPACRLQERQPRPRPEQSTSTGFPWARAATWSV